MESVLNSCLLLLHLALGCGTNVDDCHTAGELGQTLLELLAVVIRRRLVDRGFQLLDTSLDLVVIALTVDQRGRLLVDENPLARPDRSRRSPA
jgi:hypothetical protein